ncbi:MAG: hypothetical protein ACFLMY_14505 [Candidatus Brachytrichaceae bacterium NZ_4S206]|jgi:hypothetical protein
MWTLAGTYPLVMMAVWLNLAQGGVISGFGPSQFVFYGWLFALDAFAVACAFGISLCSTTAVRVHDWHVLNLHDL